MAANPTTGMKNDTTSGEHGGWDTDSLASGAKLKRAARDALELAARAHPGFNDLDEAGPLKARLLALVLEQLKDVASAQAQRNHHGKAMAAATKTGSDTSAHAAGAGSGCVWRTRRS